MENRPKINILLSPTDKICEIAGWILVIIDWILVIRNYIGLPKIIPLHFDASGLPDGFGNKINMLLLPAIATILFIGMTILNKYPHIFNYPTKVTNDNALKLYTIATRMIRYLKLAIVFIFCLIDFQMIQNIKSNYTGLGFWLLPITLGTIFIPMIYFIVQMFRKK